MPVSPGDTAWILLSSALVMLMTPGLALFYGGMVRRRNILSTIMMSFIALGLVAITPAAGFVSPLAAITHRRHRRYHLLLRYAIIEDKAGHG